MLGKVAADPGITAADIDAGASFIGIAAVLVGSGTTTADVEADASLIVITAAGLGTTEAVELFIGIIVADPGTTAAMTITVTRPTKQMVTSREDCYRIVKIKYGDSQML